MKIKIRSRVRARCTQVHKDRKKFAKKNACRDSTFHPKKSTV